MGQSDLDPRTIDLGLFGNLPIELLYQYKYVAQLETELRDNYNMSQKAFCISMQEYVGKRARF